jgi:hypothetical protein
LRHSKVLTGFFLIAFSLLIALEANATTFSVNVNNGSLQTPLTDYPVTVVVGNNNSQNKFITSRKIEVRTDSSGSASGTIETLSFGYIRAEVVYKGVVYRSQLASLSQGSNAFELSVPVYEISNDGGPVSVESRRMVVLTKNDRTLEVYETLVVNNIGNLTYVGKFNDELDMNQSLFIPMPAGYMLYGFTGYEKPKIQTKGAGIVTQNEIIPGSHEISMHYYVQSDTGEFDMELLSQKDAPEIKTITLFFPKENAWQLKQSGLKKSGEEFINKIPYTILMGRPGSALDIKVFGPTYEGGFGLWHISIILAFVLAIITLFMARDSIRSKLLAREEQRLEDLIEDMDEELSGNGIDSQHKFIRETMQKRMQYISEYFERQ